MIADLLTIGDKIDVIKINHKQEQEQQVYVSRLIDFVGEKGVKIAMPINQYCVIPLEPGERYQLCFYTIRGLYQCRSVVIERYKEENIGVVALDILSDFEKFQRRQYYRVDCIMDIEYRPISEEEWKRLQALEEKSFTEEGEKDLITEELKIYDTVWYNGIITDISGGGVRFNSKQQHLAGEYLWIHINLSINHEMTEYKLKAKFIASKELENRIGLFQHRIEFYHINKAVRENIIRFVFEEDRRRRKREREIE